MSVATCIDEYLTYLAIERGLAANTVAAYRRDLRRYAAFLTARQIVDPTAVTSLVVADFAASLAHAQGAAAPLSARSAARVIVAVRGFYQYLASTGLCRDDPSRSVKPPATALTLPKALTVDQVLAVLKAPSGALSPAQLRDHALLELLYGTGARISEVVSLDVDDVAEIAVAQTLRLIGKGGKHRIVPLGQYAIAAVDRYLVQARPAIVADRSASSALFLNLRAGRLSRQSAWTIVRQAARRADIAGELSPHVLRHSYATHLVEAGADVRVVQELLGHSSVTTTAVYTMVTKDQLRAVYQATHPRANPAELRHDG